MSKIALREPHGPYHCEIDTDTMDVVIKEAFLGVQFVTEDGERLSVCMRDSGFEISYSIDGVRIPDDENWWEFKEGITMKRREGDGGPNGKHGTTRS